MSIYNGKFQHRGLGGKLSNQTPQLRVTFTRVNDAPQVTIEAPKKLGGIWARGGKFFTGLPRRIPILYRFASASDSFGMGHSAKAGTAPAAETAASSTFVVSHEAQPIAAPAKQIKAHKGIKLGRAVLPVALLVGNLFARKSMPLGRKAAASSVPGATAASSDTIVTLDAAAGCAAPTVGTTVADAFTCTGNALATTAPASAAGATSGFVMGHSVKAATWFYPEMEDGLLVIRQAYEATKTGNVLEVK